MRPTKNELMMAMAIMVSRRSSCSRLQVGSVVTDASYEQIAIGYNGTYRGGPNDCLRNSTGSCGCIHAEINALLKCRFKPYLMFLTDSPCEACASAIVNSGVKSVMFAREYRLVDGVKLLHDAEVEVVGLRPEELYKEMSDKFTVNVREEPYNWKM